MNQKGICWLHHCTYRRDRSKCRPTTSSSLLQRTSHFRVSAGKPAAMFSHKRESSQESHSDRDGTLLAHQPPTGENEVLSRLSDWESDTRLFLEEQRNKLLSEAKSEVLKQECRAETADCAFRERQRQIQSNRMEIDRTDLGYETSRREPAPGL